MEYDDEAGIFHGEGIDLKDVITFQGRSVEELGRAFRESIDDYLEFCRERNRAYSCELFYPQRRQRQPKTYPQGLILRGWKNPGKVSSSEGYIPPFELVW